MSLGAARAPGMPSRMPLVEHALGPADRLSDDLRADTHER